MKFAVTIEDTGERYACADKESLLSGMVRLGRRGIPAGCCGGGCGVCKIEITAGEFEARVMSRQHVSVVELAQGRVLACCVYPRSDISLRVLGKMHKTVCRAQGIRAEGFDHCGSFNQPECVTDEGTDRPRPITSR